MLVFVFAPESQRTNALVHRLRLRGYNAQHASSSHFTMPRTEELVPFEQQMRRRMMRMIAESDVVAVPDGAITPEELGRLLVVCEFAGRDLVRYEDLPGECPADGVLPVVLRIGTRVAMLPTEELRPDIARMRVRHLVQRAARFFDHGRWLKNPVVSGRA